MEEVANVAVLIAGFAYRTVVELVLVAKIRVELVTVIFPRDVLFEQRIAMRTFEGGIVNGVLFTLVSV